MNTQPLALEKGACARSVNDGEVSISLAGIEDAPALRALHELFATEPGAERRVVGSFEADSAELQAAVSASGW